MYLLNIYYSHIQNLLLTGGSIMAAIGALRIKYKMDMGHPNTLNEGICWVGGIIMLLASAALVKTLFNQ